LKINILYIFWLIAAYGCYLLIRNISGQSEVTFFGTAENEGIVLNFDHTVLVKKVFVKGGSVVKKGDTLAIFMRTELDRRMVEKNNEISQYNLEKLTRSNEIIKELAVLDAKKLALQKELESQISLLKTETNIQQELKRILGNGNENNLSSSLKNEKIIGLQADIAQIEQQIVTQKSLLSQKQRSEYQLLSQKISYAQQEISFIEGERKQLILIAPMDGFVVEVFITENTIEPQLKPLIKINPTRTNRVKGFIYENAEVAYNLGDSVELASAARPTVKTKGYFISVSPEMVELPIRLRKSPEIKSWGREVYVQLPTDNQFFIGEKIMLNLRRKL
jgi:HlyD family secretion protein